MIDTLPKDIQNKIFFYVGGNITRDDVAAKIMSMKIGKRLNIERLNRDREQAEELSTWQHGGVAPSALPPYIWWYETLWNMPQLYQITKSDRWCKDLFEFVVRDRMGMCPRELPLFLIYCWEIMYYLKNDDIDYYGARVTQWIAQRFVKSIYRTTPWVLRKRRSQLQIHFIDYDKFSAAYKHWIPWDDTQRYLKDYL